MTDYEPHEELRAVLAAQVAEGMRWSVDPELADLMSDQTATELVDLASRALDAHRHLKGYGGR
jgi:hypothetical protein